LPVPITVVFPLGIFVGGFVGGSATLLDNFAIVKDLPFPLPFFFPGTNGFAPGLAPGFAPGLAPG